MVNQTLVNVYQGIVLSDSVNTSVHYSFSLNGIILLVCVLILIITLFIFKHFFIKHLDIATGDNKKKIMIVWVIALIISIFLISLLLIFGQTELIKQVFQIG